MKAIGRNNKIIIFTICIIVSNFIAVGQAKIKFDSLVYKMNPVKREEPAELKIPFKNIGNEPLIITRAQGGGTPVIDYPKEPISPNETGFLYFKMPTNFVGKTKQNVLVYTNMDDNAIGLTIYLEVIENNLSEIKIFGKVTDENNLPLPFANVSVENTFKGTQTDFDGNYFIRAKTSDSLIFSFVGFKTQKIRAEKNEINVQLHELEPLEVEFGPPYPPVRPKNLAASTVVTAKDIKKRDNLKYWFKKNAKNNVFVIFVSELTSYNFNYEDLEFQKNYNVKYSQIGTLKSDYVIKYNKLTFKYLNKKYKKNWQKDIRKDAIGLTNYIK